jgi:hypothetical protein
MKIWFTITVLLFTGRIVAQEMSADEPDPSSIADDLARFADDDANYEDLYENYLQLLSNPLNINNASTEELRTLNLLSELQISNLQKYLLENGQLISIYELQAIPGFDLNIIHKILPLVKVDDPQSQIGKSLLKRVKAEGNSYLVGRFEHTLEHSTGYEPSENPAKQFHGSPDKMYLRFRSSRNKDYSIGFTAEKDPGEAFQWNPKQRYYGADYLSFHAQVMNKKRIRNLIIGDFQYQFGQGLVLGNAFGLGKGGETVNTIRKSNIGFSPYTSVNESGHMRGAAISFLLHKKILWSSFFSNALRDAAVYADSSLHFSAMQTTGLHRNDFEMHQRKQINELNCGSVINYRTDNLDAGVIFQSINFDIPVQHSDDAYRQFTFQGNQNINASLFLNYTLHNFNFFSEAAKTLDGGAGIVMGMLTSLDPKLDMSLLFRKYDKDYISFYSNAISENTTPQNETGMYWGWKYKFNKQYSLSAYVDLFTFPWLKFRTYKPSHGNEFLMRFNYQPSKKIMLFIQFRQETKERNLADSQVYNTAPATKQNGLISCDYTVSDYVRLKTRGQFSSFTFDKSKTSGLAVMQDLVVKIKRLQITGRFSLFDTDDFENRQYAYENDVWLAYSLPAYYGQGNKNLIMIQYKLSKRLTTWIRFAHTRYIDRTEIGSGNDIISGNTRNDVKLQVRLQL